MEEIAHKILVLHDLAPAQQEQLFEGAEDLYTQVAARDLQTNCIGCFNCWLKTPGRCVIDDAFTYFPAMLSQYNEMVVISQNVYGGFSVAIKGVLDRSIGYILPFFRLIDDEMHHQLRYNNNFTYRVFFYGENITEEEQKLARDIVQGNSVNFGIDEYNVTFVKNTLQIKEALLCK